MIIHCCVADGMRVCVCLTFVYSLTLGYKLFNLSSLLSNDKLLNDFGKRKVISCYTVHVCDSCVCVYGVYEVVSGVASHCVTTVLELGLLL